MGWSVWAHDAQVDVILHRLDKGLAEVKKQIAKKAKAKAKAQAKSAAAAAAGAAAVEENTPAAGGGSAAGGVEEEGEGVAAEVQAGVEESKGE